MPISHQDLPRICEAIKELHRIIETPPGDDWQPPPWLIEQYEQTTLGKEGVPDRMPGHGYMIRVAGVEVLNQLMPPWHHVKYDCPEIEQSDLERCQKVALNRLRKQLITFNFANHLSKYRGEAILFQDFLTDVIETLATNG